jgi:transposase
MTMRRVDVNLDELDQIIDRSTRAPLSESEGQKLKTALHAMAERLVRKRSTEKTRAVLPPDGAPASQPETSTSAPVGHGRNGAAAFTGANRVVVAHATLHSGDQCPECRQGKVYRQKEPATLVRFVGHAPLEATVFEMERLRCNACGAVFTAEEPETAGADRYDETAVAMVALLKYGTGVPFKRLERLQEHLGMPLPATTQWDLMAAAAELLWPILEELIRQAAQGSVMHNDDTGMRILRLAREPGDKRTGTFTSGIVSIVGAWTVALFFTGWKHAGENLAEVLKQRARELPAPHPDERRVIPTRRRWRASSPCRRTASRMEGGRLWRWRTTFRKNAVMCWRRCATFIITTHRRENRPCRRNSGWASIRSTASR